MSLRVLVTGATSGLGREMAVQLGRRGCRVALTGRREGKLRDACRAAEEAGAPETIALQGSVTDLAEVREHYGVLEQRWGGLDWAILNAGVGDSKSALEFSAENYRWTFDTNVQGAVNWIEAALPGMIRQGDGVIAGIGSIAGFRGLPKSGAYCASKAALRTLLESTRADLQGTGVSVVTVCPGFIRSELTDRNDPRDMMFLMETEEGVRRILDGIEARRRMVVFPWQLGVLMRYVVPHLPGWAYDRIIRRFAKRRKRPYVDESRRAA